MKLRLSWIDPASQRPRRPMLEAPVALGQAFDAMPREISGKSVSRMVIGDRQAHAFQALLVEIEGRVYLIDNSGQTYVNQHRVNGQEQLETGDRIRIGQTELQLQILEVPQEASHPHSTHLQTASNPVPAPAPVQPLGPFAQSSQSNGTAHHVPAHSSRQAQAPIQPQQPISPQQSVQPQQPIQSQQPIQPPTRHQPPIQPPPLPTTQWPSLNQQPTQRSMPLPDLESNNSSPATNGHRRSPNPAKPHQHSRSPSAPAAIPQPPAPQPPPEMPSPRLRPQAPRAESQPGGGGCRRIVGFLFKRPCGRRNSAGCEDCANGSSYSSQAFSADYSLYEGFGRYELGDWGYSLLANRHNDEP